MAVGMLALIALAAALVCVLPGEKAYAETTGGTALGIIIIDSSQSGGQGQGGSTGTTTLGIRVTDSENLIKTQYELTLHHNDGTQATSSVKATYNLPLPNTLPLSRTGYTFLGYFSAASGGTQYYKADGTYARVWDQTEAKPLYAQWQAKTTQVSFDQKGGNNGQATPITATFDAKPSNVAYPDYPGYTFDGYFDGDNKQYFDEVGQCVVDKWDKEDESVTLEAHWTLQIDCAIPTSVDIEVDASGKSTTSATPEFSSSTPADIKVTAVSSTQGAGATTLFANNVVPAGVGIQLKPASSGLPVTVPLTSTGTTILGNGWTIPAGSSDKPTKFAVAFSLSLPSGAQLNYRPNTPVTVANLSYVIKIVDPS